jgi:hypothetical protein
VSPKRKRNPEPVRRASKRYKLKLREQNPAKWRSIMDARNAAARARRLDPEYREALRSRERARYHARKEARSSRPSPQPVGSAVPE